MNRYRIPLVFLLPLALVLASCGSKPMAAQAAAKEPVTLKAVEVRSYQGADLSSVNDFRENSIKGVQHVDPATYRLEITGLVTTPLSLTRDQVVDRTLYKKVVTLHCVEGWDATILWEGVKVEGPARLQDERRADDTRKGVSLRYWEQRGYNQNGDLSGPMF